MNVQLTWFIRFYKLSSIDHSDGNIMTITMTTTHIANICTALFQEPCPHFTQRRSLVFGFIVVPEFHHHHGYVVGAPPVERL